MLVGGHRSQTFADMSHRWVIAQDVKNARRLFAALAPCPPMQPVAAGSFA